MNIETLYRDRALEARRASGAKGGEWHGPCPGCGGEDRFHFWPEQDEGRGSFWCRKCGAAGDHVQFCRDFLGMTFADAARYLGRTDLLEQYGLEGGAGRRPAPAARRKPEPRHFVPVSHAEPEQLWRESASSFVARAHERLLASPEQLASLRFRGISLAAVQRFRLGWHPGEIARGEYKDAYRKREAWGLPTEINPETNKPRKLWLPRGLVIPAFNADGRLVRVKIRRPEPREFRPKCKYYVVPGSSSATMNLRPLAKALVPVEGEFDAMLIDLVAGDLVSALGLGSNTSRPDADTHEQLLASLRILTALDADDAGAEWANPRKAKSGKDAWSWAEQYPQARRWPTPDGKDPGEYWQLRLRAALEARGLSEKPPVDAVFVELANRDWAPIADDGLTAKTDEESVRAAWLALPERPRAEILAAARLHDPAFRTFFDELSEAEREAAAAEADAELRAWIIAGLPPVLTLTDLGRRKAAVAAGAGQRAAAPAKEATDATDAVQAARTPDADLSPSEVSAEAAPAEAAPVAPLRWPAGVEEFRQLLRRCRRVRISSQRHGPAMVDCGQAGPNQCPDYCKRRFPPLPDCPTHLRLCRLCLEDEAVAAFVARYFGPAPEAVQAMRRVLADCPRGAWLGEDLQLKGCEADCEAWGEDGCSVQTRIGELMWSAEGVAEWIEARGGLRE